MGDESRLRAVVGLAQALAAAQGLPGLARAAAEGAMAALGGTSATLAFRESGHDGPRLLATAGEPAARGPAGFPGHGGGRRLVAPVALEDRIWGELSVRRGPGDPLFGPGDREFAEVLADVIATGVTQYERLAEARRLAFTDPLTGLANRRAVDIRLDEALAEHRATGAVVSLVVCDVNGLKKVNDTYGHATGDRLLARFGTVLSLCGAAVPGALAARLGGDEFCLVAVGAGAAEVERVAEEVCRRAGELDRGRGGSPGPGGGGGGGGAGGGAARAGGAPSAAGSAAGGPGRRDARRAPGPARPGPPAARRGCPRRCRCRGRSRRRRRAAARRRRARRSPRAG
ncbi:GGDEF domain-containing protein [Streptomyces specialis]|uniref:GGDEF domain-containing protein n=1 Tax=Streptomyces specialis TaxID=498367 RepID=UPI00073F33D6|nr:GGDEF domain-containing protein [Streptomyces specialis]